MERKIGESFEYEGKTFKVKEGEKGSCHGCFFNKRCILPVIKVAGECAANCREDNKGVVFVEVQEQPQDEQPQELNLCEVLKYCPEGTPFWSPMLGDVKFWCVSEPLVTVEDKAGNSWDINSDSTLSIGGIGGVTSEEPMLYPSREQRDWSKWKCPKPRFDPKTLQPFDKVLAASMADGRWVCDFFSHIGESIRDSGRLYVGTGFGAYDRMIPYNDDTKHLVGTINEAPEYYRYWKD